MNTQSLTSFARSGARPGMAVSGLLRADAEQGTQVGSRPAGASAIQIPGVWRGTDCQLDSGQTVWPSGHAALDRELPGGGWPGNALIQVQQPVHCHAEWSLLLPALANRVHRLAGLRTEHVVLVAPPYLPFAPALQAAGLDSERLCCVRPGRSTQELAWACEQALHCHDVLAVLAWLPDLSLSVQRRLQLAAASQGRPIWLWQGLQAESHSSPAALRLRLERRAPDPAARHVPGLQLQILKRRGPLLEKPVQLSLLQWAWLPVLQAQADRQARQSEDAAMLMQGRVAAPVMASNWAAEA
ncbi:translesion DNA synthesis-associated protein ImuA [Comamonas sp. 26]|uniref:translesion DNA synthesis-associated protein ImuA n=1 Tax=Comamonas sp. 26 TaxID=2035201 RepID=UPI000C17AD74|nr:translesion DNA synthesis-associated protein ImuA [Comamonas sp. 26]PIG09175.1 protein ImuA [Comamonas sp. 26]